ncbi:hypothetical protein [Streptomyces sp. NPDC048350]|uniref:hypothetical protein n=1 Tax=Streptomyces sp. NPDC048350 TaxID=3365538 RepID=UPI00371CF755
MLWPTLRALAYGHMENDQLTWLLDDLGLTQNVRTEAPAPSRASPTVPSSTTRASLWSSTSPGPGTQAGC